MITTFLMAIVGNNNSIRTIFYYLSKEEAVNSNMTRFDVLSVSSHYIYFDSQILVETFFRIKLLKFYL